MFRTELREAVAGELRAAIARKQIRLDDLSNATDIPKSTLHHKLKANSDFTVTQLIQLAIALDVPAADLIAASQAGAA